MGKAALAEVLGEVKHGRAHARLALLEKRRGEPDATLEVPLVDGLAEGLPPGPPWERGRELARRLCEQLGLGSKPILNDRFGAHFGVDPSRLEPTEEAVVAGFSEDGAGRVGIVVRRGAPTTLRFAVARLLGDAMERPPSDRVMPATDLATARHKFQRAFAQEFLCPVEVVSQRVSLPHPSDEEVAAVAWDYQVSEWLIQAALMNHGLVERRYFPHLL